MKKIIFIVIIIISITTTISSCEKDDICPETTQTTPLLVIEFHDNASRTAAETELKDVIALRITTGDDNKTINTIEDRKNTNSITLPLKSFETSTSFTFIMNSEDEEDTSNETGNSDIVTFSYINKEVFISRGCGFANNYENLTETFNDGGDGTPWIRSIEILNSTIENQETAHVKIFH